MVLSRARSGLMGWRRADANAAVEVDIIGAAGVPHTRIDGTIKKRVVPNKGSIPPIHTWANGTLAKERPDRQPGPVGRVAVGQGRLNVTLSRSRCMSGSI